MRADVACAQVMTLPGCAALQPEQRSSCAHPLVSSESAAHVLSSAYSPQLPLQGSTPYRMPLVSTTKQAGAADNRQAGVTQRRQSSAMGNMS